MELEKRTYSASDLRVESRENGPPIITGHASVFDVIGDGGWFREKVVPGAFSDSLGIDDIRMLWNHNTDLVMSRNHIGNPRGTLELAEDEKGLAIMATPPDTVLMRGYLDMIERGDVSQMSFGFQVLLKDWIEEEGEKDLRLLKKIKLWEVSPVTFPFYKGTDVSLKAEHRQWRDSMVLPVYKSKLFRRRLNLPKR